jgi:hypothetical protein
MSDEKEDSPEIPLKVVMETCEVGKMYPLYGMITSIESESPEVVVIINRDIRLRLLIPSDDLEHLNVIKDRVFEPGIFITTITKVEKDLNEQYRIEGDVQTVVFGKKHMTEFDA